MNDPLQPFSARHGRTRSTALLRAAGALLLGLGWLSFATIGAALVIENHPRLEAWTVERVRSQLSGPLAGTLEIEDIDILWMQRSVALRGVRLGPTGDELRAGEVVCRIGFGGNGGPLLDRVTIRDADVLVTEALSAGLAAEGPSDGDSDASVFDLLTNSPEVVVRNLGLAVELAPGRNAPLGTVDLSMTHDGRGAARSRIFGRLLPSYLGPDQLETGVVWLRGTLGRDRKVEVEGVARSLLLALDPISAEGTPLEGALDFDPRARVDLALEARIDLERSLLPDVDATLAVQRGSFRLPWLARADERLVEDVGLALEVSYRPTGSEDTNAPTGWGARGVLDAHWGELAGRAGFRAGGAAPDGELLELWADLPNAPLGPELGELAAGERGITEVEAMLEPRGVADVSLSVRLPADREAGTPVAQALERLVLIEPNGACSLAYHGAYDRFRGVRDVGFPLPVRRVEGDVTWSIVPGDTYAGQLAFYAARGHHDRGPVDVRGSLHFIPSWEFERPELARLVPAPFHLVVESTNLTVDAAFEDAFSDLYAIPELKEFLPTWNPEGGSIGFRLELVRTLTEPLTSLALDIALEGLGARWRELPIPVRDVQGEVRVRTAQDTRTSGRSTTTIALQGKSDVSTEPFRVRGRIRSDGPHRSLGWTHVEAPSLNPRSQTLRETLQAVSPEGLAALEAAGAKGFMDLVVDTASTLPATEARVLRAADPERNAFAGGLAVHAIAFPERTGPAGSAGRRVTVQAPEFPVATRDVEGSVRLSLALPPDPRETAAERLWSGVEGPAEDLPGEPALEVVARLQGEWLQAGPSVPLALFLGTTPGGALGIDALGAGLDIANDGLMGTVVDAVRRAGEDEIGQSDPIDTDAINLVGRIDFAAHTVLPETPGAPPEDVAIDVEARLDRLAIGGSQVLRGVSAHLEFSGDTGMWVGTEIEAKLGSTPVQLSSVEWTPTDDGSVFRTELAARGLPIDEEHLDFFLDAHTKRVILDDLRARGTFDLRGAELTLERRGDGSTSVALDGTLGIENGFIDLGVPIELARVEEVDLRLVHEGRGLRARGFVDGAFGAIAGRRLENATLDFTYIDPRLVIEGFDGAFEGGRLHAIGRSVSRAANLFTIDLEDPFPFELAAALRDVDVGEFLRGVFDSDFADRGRLDLDLRLAGNFEELTELAGGGTIVVSDSALWSIPVFQALSTTLGIDTTVLFREMRCDYRIADGVLSLDRMRVDSDLLSLEGGGRISFEGDVTSDLEVKYSLVDRLGPFTRLLYWVQNSLLRVTIRGTMERPTVILRGLVSQLFKPSEDRDRLPLPGFSKLRRRF